MMWINEELAVSLARERQTEARRSAAARAQPQEPRPKMRVTTGLRQWWTVRSLRRRLDQPWPQAS